MTIKGVARLDRRTKNLVKRLKAHEIAIIDHRELDELAAKALLGARVKAVVNASPSLSSSYPNPGPLELAQAGVYLLDQVGEQVFTQVPEGSTVEIEGAKLYCGGVLAAQGQVLTEEIICSKMNEARGNISEVLLGFVHNTLDYAQREMVLINGDLPIPEIDTAFDGRHALIVVRGHNYMEDLAAIKSYISEVRPVLVGVDGGADALWSFGHRPHVIVGDMDSVSDKVLSSGAELLVHAYTDGRAPGLERISSLGLKAKLIPAPGTSEDIAMLLAYEKGATLIVALGSHSNVQDFLEKGRKGMGSTFLVRLKVGTKLIDAKGVSQLYTSRVRPAHLARIFLAALLPVAAIILFSQAARQTLRLLFINFRLMMGI